MKHYWCYQVLSKDMRAVTISDAVNFCHHNIPGPALAKADKLLGALQCLNTNLANRSDTTCQTNWLPLMPYERCYMPPAHTETPRTLQNRSTLHPLRHQPRHLQGWFHQQHPQGWTRRAGPRSYDNLHTAQPHYPRSQLLHQPGPK